MIEIVVSVSLFSILMLAATAVFKSVLESQANAISAQNTQESLRFAFEIMSKEIRHARQSDGSCDIPGGNVDEDTQDFEVYRLDDSGSLDAVGGIFYFLNKNHECVYYYLKTDGNGIERIAISRDADPSDGIDNGFYITPDEVEVSDLYFRVYDNEEDAPPDRREQPLVVFKIELGSSVGPSRHSQNTIMQTAISSRHY